MIIESPSISSKKKVIPPAWVIGEFKTGNLYSIFPLIHSSFSFFFFFFCVLDAVVVCSRYDLELMSGVFFFRWRWANWLFWGGLGLGCDVGHFYLKV